METLTVRRCELPEARPYLALAAAVCVGGACTADELAEGSALFALDEGPRTVGALAVQVHDEPHGRALEIVALGGRHPAIVDTVKAWAERERDRIGARTLRAYTRRPGLRRIAQRKGWTVQGETLRA